MCLALMEAEVAYNEGEVPVGAVVICGGEVMGRGHNEVEATGDSAAHAEMIALRSAAKRSSGRRLNDSVLYVTLEPCPMCAFAAMLNRVETIVFGASDLKFGGCGSVVNITSERLFNHRPEVIGGILEEECVALMQRFFKDIR